MNVGDVKYAYLWKESVEVQRRMICFLSLSLISSLPFYLFRTFIFLTFSRIPVPSLLFDQAVVVTSSELCHVKTLSYIFILQLEVAMETA